MSDEELEYQTHECASFRRFLGLSPAAAVPDAKIIWLFRKRLSEADLIEHLFQQFEQFLQHAGYEAKGGQIIDATIVPVPIQRNSREENKQIKAVKFQRSGKKTLINNLGTSSHPLVMTAVSVRL